MEYNVGRLLYHGTLFCLRASISLMNTGEEHGVGEGLVGTGTNFLLRVQSRTAILGWERENECMALRK